MTIKMRGAPGLATEAGGGDHTLTKWPAIKARLPLGTSRITIVQAS